MAQAGGLLDQPRRWWRAIEFMQARFSDNYRMAKADKAESAYWAKLIGTDDLSDLIP